MLTEKLTTADDDGLTKSEKEILCQLWKDRILYNNCDSWNGLGWMLHGIFIWEYEENPAKTETMSFLSELAHARAGNQGD
jgi:hypothetical protein